MNSGLYQVPTLALLAALVAVFGGLWLQWRPSPGHDRGTEETPDLRRRHLLWLAGWFLAALRLWLQVSGREAFPAGRAISYISMELAPLMFLASLASQYLFRRPRILYVMAFGLPLVLFAAAVGFDPTPGPRMHGFLLACAFAALCIGALWGLKRNLMPIWVSLVLVMAFGAPCLWLVAHGRYLGALYLVRSGCLAVAAFLFAAAFRRITAGLVFTVGGLATWSLAGIQCFQLVPQLPADLVRLGDLVKVLTAIGMVVLVLEDEIAVDRAGQLSDRQARWAMERYSQLYLAAMPQEPGPEEYNEVCEAIAASSRFGAAAVFLRTEAGRFRLVGGAGLAPEAAAELDLLAQRVTDEQLGEIAGLERAAPEVGQLVKLDLTPLIDPAAKPVLQPFRQVRAIGIRVRDGEWQGGLLLGNLRDPERRLRADDVMPLETLATRIAAARENSLLLRRLMQSERLAGLGQLASGVAHELNNPLTAVTGFAELLTENENSGVRERAGVILSEARRMRKIIESLVRFRRGAAPGRAAVSVALLLQDLKELLRHDLEKSRVELDLRIPAGLPAVVGDDEQIRQVFLQVVKNSITTLEGMPPGEPRHITVLVSRSAGGVRTTFSDSGPGFTDPSRVFDPFYTTRNPGEGMGLGLSLCYSIIHEQGGEISASNIEPRGAAVVIDLPAEEKASRTAGGPGGRQDDSLARAI